MKNLTKNIVKYTAFLVIIIFMFNCSKQNEDKNKLISFYNHFIEWMNTEEYKMNQSNKDVIGKKTKEFISKSGFKNKEDFKRVDNKFIIDIDPEIEKLKQEMTELAIKLKK
ncbi:MAG: hypothetical protein ACRDFC_01920 [Ignavibacteria bacterium]